METNLHIQYMLPFPCDGLVEVNLKNGHFPLAASAPDTSILQDNRLSVGTASRETVYVTVGG